MANKQLSETKNWLIIFALVLLVGLIGVWLVVANQNNQADDRKQGLQRLEQLISAESTDEGLQMFVIDEYLGYSEFTSDEAELRKIVELSAVLGFLQEPFQSKAYEVLKTTYELPGADLTIFQYRAELGDQNYFLSVGVNDELEILLLHLDEEPTGFEELKDLNKTDVGFEVIERLTNDAAN